MRRLGSMLRAASVLAAAALLASSVRVNAHNRHGSRRFELVEATIGSIQQAIEDDIVTAEQVVEMYLNRIAVYDGKQTAAHLNSYLAVNRDALRDGKKGHKGHGHGHGHGNHKGPLFGIPVILKDNIDTEDMPTTAGSLALQGSFPRSDAFVTRKLLDADAIIIGKATMTEYANFLTNGMPAGYSSLGGYGYNPYDPRPDPRSNLDALGRPMNDGRPVLTPGGSSSGPGIAVAANLAAIGVGTETSGSILSPGTANMLVGIKPTVGLISRDGIIPITADQDTAGPLARTVRDAAILLGVMAGFDPKDPATEACLVPGNCFHDYTRFLDPHALNGARIFVPLPPTNRAAIIANAVAVLRSQGATVFESTVGLAAQLAGCPSRPPAANYPPVSVCSTVLNYGFKRDLNKYFEDHVRHSFPIQSLADVVAFNAAHMPAATKYDQDLAIFSEMFDTSAGSRDTLRYQSDRAEDITRSRAAIALALNGPDGLPDTADDYDALLFSGNSGAGTPAKAGYPSIVVPGGFFDPNDGATPAFPTGFVAKLGPAGVTFSGLAFSEPRLIALAYAFEQATRYRMPPPSAPPLHSDTVIGR